MGGPVEGFRNHWEFVHSMTLAFANDMPDDVWDFSPHGRFATFRKQLRHVVCVRGAYNDTLVSGRADFARKHEQYAGSLDRDDLIAALVKKHEDLLEILRSLPAEGTSIEFLGRTLPFPEFTHVMVQHEAIHLGQWSLYATLAGFETPLLWRLNWGL